MSGIASFFKELGVVRELSLSCVLGLDAEALKDVLDVLEPPCKVMLDMTPKISEK